MRKLNITLIALIALAMTGCLIPSLHPLLLTKDALKISNIEGKWYRQSEIWEFTPKDSNLYELNIITPAKPEMKNSTTDTSQYEFIFGRLGKQVFYEMYPIKSSTANLALIFMSLMIPIHCFGTYTICPDSLVLNTLSFDWFKEQCDKKKMPVRAEKMESGQWLITASTKELKAFAQKHAGNEKAFTNEFHLMRNRETEK